jgi:hypothetical protein
MQMLMQAILESLKDLEQSNTKNVQSAASDAASKENNVVKDCNDATLEPDASSLSASVTNTGDKHTTDHSGKAKATKVGSEDSRAVNGAAPASASETQASTQITSEKTARMKSQEQTPNSTQEEDGTSATLVVQKSRTGGLIVGLTQKWGSFFKNND